MKKLAAILILTIAGFAAFAQQAQQPAPFTCGGGTCHGTHPAMAANDDADRDGNSVLGQSFNMTKCGLNYVYGSRHITTRSNVVGSGFPASISIAGLPSSVVIEKAFMY